MNREPVLIFASVLAAAQVLVASSLLADVIGPKAAGIAALVVAAVGTAWGVYTREQVTPWRDVAARRDPDTGTTVSGPADTIHPDGAPVIITPVHDTKGA